MSMLNRSPRPVDYLSCYALFGLLLVIGYFAVFVIWRATIVLLIEAFIGPNRINQSLYMLSMLFLGMALFVMILGAEHYLRTGIPKRRVLNRFLRLAVPLVLFGVLGLLLQQLSLAMLG
jgi:hypothetical protein